MVFLAAGDYHHHIGLNALDGAGATPPAPGHTGLYHVAFLYPDRRELARAVARLLDHGVAIDHGTDHGANVAVYLTDPDGDGNGIELSYDRPRSHWHDAGGRPVLANQRFDPRDLLSDPDQPPHPDRRTLTHARPAHRRRHHARAAPGDGPHRLRPAAARPGHRRGRLGRGEARALCPGEQVLRDQRGARARRC